MCIRAVATRRGVYPPKNNDCVSKNHFLSEKKRRGINMTRGQQESKIVSSLLLQILLYFNRWFVGLFVVLNIATFIQRLLFALSDTHAGIGIDVVSVVLFALLEGFRIFTASLGNKTEQTTPLGVGICLGLGSIMMNVFFLVWQIYVLRFDVILNAISIAFIGLELILSVLAMIMFQSANFGIRGNVECFYGHKGK